MPWLHIGFHLDPVLCMQVRSAGEPFSLTPPFMVGVQCFLAWLLYFYTALALRENVLKARAPAPHKPCVHAAARSATGCAARTLHVHVLQRSPLLSATSGTTVQVW